MRIAVSVGSEGSDTRSAQVVPRFGRAARFAVVDTEARTTVFHDNAQNLNAAQGAGIQAAETVLRLGSEGVITGNVGPKAFRALQAAGINVYLCKPMAVADALAALADGALQACTAASVEGHWA